MECWDSFYTNCKCFPLQRCEVGVQELPKNSPLGRLRGSDNVVSFFYFLSIVIHCVFFIRIIFHFRGMGTICFHPVFLKHLLYWKRSALLSSNLKNLIILYVDANGSWKYTLDATVINRWLFKVLELEMTLLQLVSLLILWMFRIYSHEWKVFLSWI